MLNTTPKDTRQTPPTGQSKPKPQTPVYRDYASI